MNGSDHQIIFHSPNTNMKIKEIFNKIGIDYKIIFKELKV